MRLALKTATKLLATIPKSIPSFSHTRTLILPLHSRRSAKTLVRLTTPSFHSIVCTPMSKSEEEEHKIKLSAIEKSILDRLLADPPKHFSDSVRRTTPSFHSIVCTPMSKSEEEVKIKLSPIEQNIFDRLKATLRHFELQTQLRVAGGWVCDKLLGKDCYDVDIALDSMMGTEFVDKVREYLQSIGEDVQGGGVIESNPDQSKHLETARMRLFDMWIDFVNLRSEEYAENSRIPTKICLFYNINTEAVEDFTERGISDLESRMIVTPLPPKATFLDDPLRVLRAIRFAARFEFTLDEDLKKAAACDDVKDALAAKISR
ncbi:hypothetical protein OROGR_027783 [Orobanche gracilis]